MKSQMSSVRMLLLFVLCDDYVRGSDFVKGKIIFYPKLVKKFDFQVRISRNDKRLPPESIPFHQVFGICYLHQFPGFHHVPEHGPQSLSLAIHAANEPLK